MRVLSSGSKLRFAEIGADNDVSIPDRQILGPQFQQGEDDDGQDHAADVDPEL